MISPRMNCAAVSKVKVQALGTCWDRVTPRAVFSRGGRFNLVKNLPAVQVTWVRSLGWEDPLEKEMATHSSILAWEIPWALEPDVIVHGVTKHQTRLSN